MSVFQATGNIRDCRQTSRWVRARIGNNDLIGVRVDYQICIMSDNDHLSFGFGHYEEKDEFVEY
jgi:hypothetical protein